MAFFEFLKRKPAVSIEHPIFGSLILQKGKKGPYWMHESYNDDEITVTVETTGDAPPTEGQAAFYSEIVRDAGVIFEKCASQIAAQYENFFRKPLPRDWREAFRLASVGVPLSGSASDSWDITFECLTNRSGFLFTCYFVGGQPEEEITVDT